AYRQGSNRRSPETAESEDRSGRPARLLRKWRSQSPFDQDEWFAELAAQTGIDEESFINLFADVPDLDARPDHPWTAAFDHYTSPVVPEGVLAAQDPFLERELRGFCGALLPLVRPFFSRLTSAVDGLSSAYPSLPFDAVTITRLLCSELPSLLSGIIDKVGVL